MRSKIDRANDLLASFGYRPLDKKYKPFSASWYLRTMKYAKLKLRATIDMCSEVPTEDTALFSTYAFVLHRQCLRYQFVLRRAYAAFSREAFGIGK